MKYLLFTLLIILSHTTFAQIKLKNNVELTFDYDVMRHLDKLSAERSQKDKWNIEKHLMSAHHQCLMPHINADNQLTTDDKKVQKAYKGLRKHVSKFDAYYKRRYKERNVRKYFLTTRNTFSERSRKIMEKVDWQQQDESTLNELLALRRCYFNFHGALNRLERVKRNYNAERRKEERAAKLYRGLGLSEDASEIMASLTTNKKKEGSDRRTSTPAFFENIKFSTNLGKKVERKELTRLIGLKNRFLDYQQACRCQSTSNFCSVLANYDISGYVTTMNDVITPLQAMQFKKSVKVGDDPIMMQKIEHLKASGKEIKQANKALYRNLRENLKIMGTSGQFEQLYCIVDGFSDNI
jgi:hypothetical protein